MRKMTIVLLCCIGVVLNIIYVFFTFHKIMDYNFMDKNISDTYIIDLVNINSGRYDTNIIIDAPFLFKIKRSYTTVSGNTVEERECIDQVKIWTKTKTVAYFLGKNNPYIKLDLENNQEFIYEVLNDYTLEDQEIFKKLEAHPELFLDAQEPSPIYKVKGRGEVPFRKLK